MPMRTLQAPQGHKGQPVTLRADILWNSPNVATGYQLGVIAAGAELMHAKARTVTAFDGTTPAITVGTNSPAYDNILAAADLTEGSIGAVISATGAPLAFATDTPVFAKLTAPGATVGKATVMLNMIS
jgi:hypothetical protein